MNYELKPKQRIDLQMMEVFPGLTRSSIKKLIIDGVIKVNGEQKMPNYRPKNGDTMTYEKSEIDTYLNSAGSLKLDETKMELQILFEDENTLIIFKPIGLHVHPVTKTDTKSLLNGVYYFMSHESKFDPNVRLRLVNRIDRETSGIVLISKNLEAHDFYSKQFEEHTVTKEYLAVVQGDFFKFLENTSDDILEITNYISNNSDEENRYYSTSTNNGRLAQSKIQFLDYFHEFGQYKFSKVLVTIKTGRTHQIRVHLSELGFPLLGDPLYEGHKYNRLMLHAYRLVLDIYKGEKDFEVIAEEPEEFKT